MWGVDEEDVRGRQTPVAHAASMMEKQKAMDRWKRVCVCRWVGGKPAAEDGLR